MFLFNREQLAAVWDSHRRIIWETLVKSFKRPIMRRGKIELFFTYVVVTYFVIAIKGWRFFITRFKFLIMRFTAMNRRFEMFVN